MDSSAVDLLVRLTSCGYLRSNNLKTGKLVKYISSITWSMRYSKNDGANLFFNY